MPLPIVELKSLQSALSVWKALFLREAMVRMFGTRMAWCWLVVEPVANVLWLVLIFSIIRIQHVGGIETALWIVCGMLVFMTFRRTVSQVQNGVGANVALFAYRQVRPADVVLVRAAVEGASMFVISGTVFLVGAAIGWMAWPASMWSVLEAFTAAWLCGLGLGMIFGVLARLIPEAERIINFLMTPLMMISGVMVPLGMVHEPYRGWLMYNPLAHAIEASRLGFAPYYHAASELDLSYAYQCALVLVFLGLALFRRFNQRLVMQ